MKNLITWEKLIHLPVKVNWSEITTCLSFQTFLSQLCSLKNYKIAGKLKKDWSSFNVLNNPYASQIIDFDCTQWKKSLVKYRLCPICKEVIDRDRKWKTNHDTNEIQQKEKLSNSPLKTQLNWKHCRSIEFNMFSMKSYK